MRKFLVFATILIILLLCTIGCSERVPLNVYGVSFDSNGGSKISAVSMGEVSTCPIPTKDGYIFEGWYTEKELTNMVEFPYMPTKNITLFAKYIDIERGNEEIVYNLQGNNYEATAYNGLSQNVVIPSNYLGKPVKTVSLGFLKNLNSLKNFYISENLRKIDEIFYNCRNFESFILLGDNEYFSVSDGILYDAGEVELLCVPRNKTFADNSFSLPDTVKTVARNSLRYVDSLQTLTFGKNFATLEENLSYVRGLEKIEVESGNKFFSSDNGILYDKDKKSLISCPVCFGKTCTLFVNTERVEDGAFNNCNIEVLNINAELSYFGVQERIPNLSLVTATDNSTYYTVNGVLYDGKKNELVLYPANRFGEKFVLNEVVSIGKNAFAYTQNLKSLVVAAEVVKISQFAFNFASIKTIVFEEGSMLNEIDSTAFLNSDDLETVHLTATVPPKYENDERVNFDIYVPEVSFDKYAEEWKIQYLKLKSY